MLQSFLQHFFAFFDHLLVLFLNLVEKLSGIVVAHFFCIFHVLATDVLSLSRLVNSTHQVIIFISECMITYDFLLKFLVLQYEVVTSSERFKVGLNVQKQTTQS